MPFKRLILTIALTALLPGCATMFDRSTQNITINTPGTNGAICYLERPGYRQRVWAPKTVRIPRDRKNLTVHCIAPGNREKTVVLEPTNPTSLAINAANGFVGAFVDYETGAMFILPDTVTVDFTNVPASREPLPDYQALLKENPHLRDLEEFRPGRSALQKDRLYQAPELELREPNSDLFFNTVGSLPSEAEAAEVSNSGIDESELK